MRKRIPAIILMFALFLTTSYAANTYRKTITVTSGVNVEFNNEAIDMTDANGKAVEAFIYNGTTYVPIRAVSNAFGADIGYDRNTQTISIYDDFSEVAAVAHDMSNILSDCSNVLMLGYANVGADSTDSLKESFDNMKTINSNLQSTLQYLDSDDGYNNCIGLLDTAVKQYNIALAAFNTAGQSYESYAKSGSTYAATTYLNDADTAYDEYINAQNAITDFFYDYAMWRDV